MHYMLFAVGVLLGGFATLFFLFANGAIQQAAAGTLMTVAAVFIAAGTVADAIHRLRRELLDALRAQAKR